MLDARRPVASFLKVRHLTKTFPVRRASLVSPALNVTALNDISLDIARGEVLAVVGESGSGKSTLGRVILQLQRATSGSVEFDSVELTALRGKALRRMRSRMQIVFQDPFSSLNPHMAIGDALDEVLLVQRPEWKTAERRERIAELVSTVGLPESAMRRFPHQFSGGQRQRIGIARAIAGHPELLVADEPVSALDVSVQAQIINLLSELKESLDLTILFISHDLAVVRHIATRIAVMYLGTVVEIGDADEVLNTPRHPYTEALLSAVHDPHRAVKRERIILKGDMPSPVDPPSGCVFRTRCPYALARCAEQRPLLEQQADGHRKACVREDLALAGV